MADTETGQVQNGQNTEMTEAELLREEAKQLLFGQNQTPEKKREGLKMMISACDAGDPEAMFVVGKMLLEGKLIPKKGRGTEMGISLLCRAAKASSQQARSQLLWYRHLRYREVRKRNRGPVEGPLTGFDGSGYMLSANMMGDDFTLCVEGDCKLGVIYVWGDSWGAGLKIAGSGTLTVNENKPRFIRILIHQIKKLLTAYSCFAALLVGL